MYLARRLSLARYQGMQRAQVGSRFDRSEIVPRLYMQQDTERDQAHGVDSPASEALNDSVSCAPLITGKCRSVSTSMPPCKNLTVRARYVGVPANGSLSFADVWTLFSHLFNHRLNLFSVSSLPG